MPFTPGGLLNPNASILFCPDQTDFLTFRTPDGFGAVYLDLVEGFTAMNGKGSAVHLTNQIWYESIESVPELVARFASVKKRRYDPERAKVETQGQGLTTRTVPGPTEPIAGEKSSLPARPTVWTNGPAKGAGQ